MTISLPVVDAARSEFGFARTVCDCVDCTLSCRHIPGYLIPSDLDRLVRDADPFAWANEHLLASPGAIVMRNGKTFRIPTLVPARRCSGACMFLTADNHCAIHADAPFGCAFFDSHMGASECDRRSQRGLRAVMDAWIAEGLYAQVWSFLHLSGLRAPAPEICRQRLWQANQHTSKETRK